jgi:thioredoxin 1
MNAEFAASNVDVVIVKVECAAKNKDLGKELGVRVAPTFHVYKGKDKVGEMTGAKADQLRALIQQNLPQA